MTDIINMMPAQVLTLEYAAPEALSGEARSAFRLLFVVSILSGLCVGACFLSFSENVLAWALHVIIFAATIILAIKAGRRIARLGSNESDRIRFVLDLLALVGILIIGISPVVYGIGESIGTSSDRVLYPAALGLAYSLLACTTARHVLLYRFLATLCRQVGRLGMARGLLVLGWFKAIYEFLWLASCALGLLILAGHKAFGTPSDDPAIFFAFVGLFGAMGFGAIWVWMMISHGLLMRVAR